MPTELLVPIICDILANFLHAAILQPSNMKLWNGLHTLRLVSKRIKSTSDACWTKSVGPPSGDGSSFWKQEIAVSRGVVHLWSRSPQMPIPSDCTMPLMAAYRAYVLGILIDHKLLRLIAQDDTPSEKQRLKATFWFNIGLAAAQKVVPREMGAVIIANLRDQVWQSHIDSMKKEVEDLTGWLKLEPQTTFDDTRSLVKLEPHMMRLLNTFKSTPDFLRHLGRVPLLSLRDAIMSLFTQEDDNSAASETARNRISSIMESIWEQWNDSQRAATMHSRVMQRTVVYANLR